MQKVTETEHVFPDSKSLRVKGCKQEVQQEADGLLHVDLVSGWHPFVELVKNGGEHSL